MQINIIEDLYHLTSQVGSSLYYSLCNFVIESQLKFLDLGWQEMKLYYPLLRCKKKKRLKLTYVVPRRLNKLLSVKLTWKKLGRVQICSILVRQILRLSGLFLRSVFWSWAAEGSFSNFPFPHPPALLRSVGGEGRVRGVEGGRWSENEFGKFPPTMMFLLQPYYCLKSFRRLLYASRSLKYYFLTILSRVS